MIVETMMRLKPVMERKFVTAHFWRADQSFGFSASKARSKATRYEVTLLSLAGVLRSAAFVPGRSSTASTADLAGEIGDIFGYLRITLKWKGMEKIRKDKQRREKAFKAIALNSGETGRRSDKIKVHLGSMGLPPECDSPRTGCYAYFVVGILILCNGMSARHDVSKAGRLFVSERSCSCIGTFGLGNAWLLAISATPVCGLRLREYFFIQFSHSASSHFIVVRVLIFP